MVRNNNLFLKYFRSDQRQAQEDVPETDFELKHGDSLYDMFTKLEFAEGLELSRAHEEEDSDQQE